MIRATLLFLIVPLFILTASCERDDNGKRSEKPPSRKEIAKTKKPIREPVAVVGGHPIYKEDIADRSLDEAIEEEILYQIGIERKIDKEVEKDVTLYKRSLIVEKTQERIISELKPVISEEELLNYFNKNRSLFSTIELMDITVPDRDIASEIKDRIYDGEDIDALLSELQGEEELAGQITSKSYNRVVDVFSEALEENAQSVIIDENGKYKVVVLLAKRPATLKESYELVSNRLRDRKTEEAFTDLMNKMKGEKKVTIKLKDLPKTEGTHPAPMEKPADKTEKE